MHPTVKLIEAAVPWLTPQGHAVVTNLAIREGCPGPAHLFARTVGLRSRFQLSRLLQREGLPCLEELAGWIRILILVVGWEESGTTLSNAALSIARDPAPLYRMVERLTGYRWTDVRARGSTWVLLQLVERCRAVQEGTLRRRTTALDAEAS